MGKMETVPESPALSAEQAAELAALEAGAASGSPVVGQVEETPAPPVVNLAEEIKALVLAFVAMSKPILPSLSLIYTEESTAAAAEVVAALCQKHGWAENGLMGDYGEEVAAAIVLIPLGFATTRAVKADIEAGKNRGKKEPEKAVIEPAEKAVQVPSESLQGWQPGASGANG